MLVDFWVHEPADKLVIEVGCRDGYFPVRAVVPFSAIDDGLRLTSVDRKYFVETNLAMFRQFIAARYQNCEFEISETESGHECALIRFSTDDIRSRPLS